MSHFGIFCPPLPGHLHPCAAIGRALISRGHRVTVFQFEPFRRQVEAEELEFCALGTDVPLASRVLEMGQAKNLRSLRVAIEGARQSAENICLHGPAMLAKHAIDAVLADQNEPAGGTVAEHLRIPFVTLCPSLPLNREPNIPPPFVGWQYSASAPARLRNAVGLRVADLLIAPINRVLNQYRRKWQLAPLRSPDDSFSHRAQLSQMTRSLDFPRERLPETFHYLGPWLDSAERKTVEFPYDRLDGRPLIYASFGTLQPDVVHQFSIIAEACRHLDVQLVIAAGAAASRMDTLPGEPIIVAFAPQLKLLRIAQAVITHGGMNTAMQALHFGKPMLVLPQTHDQPAIAARLARCGAGMLVSPQQVTAQSVLTRMETLLSDARYTSAAMSQKDQIQQSGGLPRAIELIESAIL